MGSYVVHRESNLSLQYLIGYAPGAPYALGNQLNYLDGTSLKYEQLQLGESRRHAARLSSCQLYSPA